MDESKREVEVKIRFESVDEARALLSRGPVETIRERYFEDNVVFDREDRSLKAAGRLLRLRRIGDEAILTYKAPVPGEHRHKVRVEEETAVSDADVVERTLVGVGFRPVYRYQKYRSIFRSGPVEICLDETPIGCFVELEGPPDAIDRLAGALGIAEDRYVKETYRELHERYAEERGQSVGDLVFEPVGNR